MTDEQVTTIVIPPKTALLYARQAVLQGIVQLSRAEGALQVLSPQEGSPSMNLATELDTIQRRLMTWIKSSERALDHARMGEKGGDDGV